MTKWDWNQRSVSTGPDPRASSFAMCFESTLEPCHRRNLWHRHNVWHRRLAGVLLRSVVLLIVAAWIAPIADARAQSGAVTGPDLTIGAAEYPDDDAIILRWEQHWTLEKDGKVRRRDHKWLKLLNSRPIRSVADPRLDYRVGEDELIIHTAQTILPNGKVLPVPDYSFNKVGPDDVAGWPAYNGWEQTVVSFSGIEHNCILELDYEVVTRPGVFPWMEGDLRLNQNYPTVDRVVSVTVPAGTGLKHKIDNLSPAPSLAAGSTGNGATTYRWSFSNLAGAAGEPQSLPWRSRCGRLRFTTCASTDELVGAFAKRVDKAARSDAAIKKFAQAAVEQETDPRERVRKVAKKLHGSFNFINSPKTFRSLDCRNAADVLRCNYGSPLEAAALLTAALRSLGMDATVQVAVDADSWDDKVPTRSDFAGLVAAVNLPGGPVHVHPRHGVLKNPGHWGRHWLLSHDKGGKLCRTYVAARGEKAPSEIQITGKIIVDDKGEATGDLSIRLTGGFYDPRELETGAKQEALIKKIVGRVLSDCKVTDHSIATLSDDLLKATAKVASKSELVSFDKRHLLQFGERPAFLSDFPIPLGRSGRKTDVHTAGRFIENVDLTVELPEGWGVAILPASLPLVVGPWGSAEQTVKVDGRNILFHCGITTKVDTITSAKFPSLREAVNVLRAASSRILFVGPGDKAAEKPEKAGAAAGDQREPAATKKTGGNEAERTQATDMIYVQVRIRMEEALIARAALLKAGKAPSDPEVKRHEDIIKMARELLLAAGEMVADVEPPLSE